eukprot:jgi/Antlo1/549/296
MNPADLAVGQAGPDQLGVVGVAAVLCMGQYGFDLDDGGVFEFGGEEMLLFALPASAEPLDLNGWQRLAGGQGLIEHW